MDRLKPSDFVECIDAEPIHAQSRAMPVAGGLYTVESLRAVDGGYSVRLREITPECYRGGPCQCGECGWDVRRFRKLARPMARQVDALKALLDQPVQVPGRGAG